jgi:hypothetical protein
MRTISVPQLNELANSGSSAAIQFMLKKIGTNIIIGVVVGGVVIALIDHIAIGAGLGLLVTMWLTLYGYEHSKRDPINSRVIYGGTIYTFVIPPSEGNPDIWIGPELPDLSDLHSAIRFDFPGWGWAENPPKRTILKTRREFADAETPSAVILTDGLPFYA